MMNWISENSPNIELLHNIKFKSTQAESNIAEVTLRVYPNNCISISVKPRTDYHHKYLKVILENAGFSEPIIRVNLLLGFNLETNDTQFIGVFLRTLATIQDDINHLIYSISKNLEIQFESTYVPPAWISKDNFTNDESSRLRLYNITYVNTQTGPRIGQITLNCYQYGKIELEAKVVGNYEYFESIAAILANAGLAAPIIDINNYSQEFTLASNDKQFIGGNCLRTISSACHQYRQPLSIGRLKYDSKKEFSTSH